MTPTHADTHHGRDAMNYAATVAETSCAQVKRARKLFEISGEI